MLTFSCNVGFTISTGGTTSATCQAGTFLFNPSFSGTQCFPNCAQDDATLDPLGNLDINPNQPVTGNGYSFGTVLTYSCTDTSQAFVGESTLTCQTNGNYDNPVPTCSRGCPRPSDITGGTFGSDENVFAVDEMLTFSCNVGFTISTGGTTSATCQAGTFLFNPSFSGTQCFPNCAQDDATLDPLGNLDIDPSQPATGNGYSFDTVLTYSCTDTSQAFVGESTLTCQTNGNYDNPVPTCSQGCPRPSDITGGSFSSDENVFAVDEMLTFSCNVGFTISTGGTTSATCQAGTFLFNPSFSGTQCFPNCAQDDATLDPLGNLDIDPSQPATGNGYSFDTVLTYSCTDTSQAFVGESTLTCQTNGNYDNPVPTCSQGCPRPSDITGGSFSSDENVFAVDEMLTFSCNVGFTISTGGTTSATCQAGTFLFNPSFSGTQCFPNCAQDDATLDPLGNLDIDPNQPATGNGYSFDTVLTL
ncbi:CUB and sushi domain-containing protein 3-like [Clavelina lepadiformis]|uniref:CUB and sushi domain-containing protein 3-like n=1 Tax=Clavelina lepadiformis TaxID=159417 RepID=UPI0040425B01